MAELLELEARDRSGRVLEERLVDTELDLLPVDEPAIDEVAAPVAVALPSPHTAQVDEAAWRRQRAARVLPLAPQALRRHHARRLVGFKNDATVADEWKP